MPPTACHLVLAPRRRNTGRAGLGASCRRCGTAGLWARCDRRYVTVTVVYESMANGQVVLITTEPLGGGSAVRSVYFVAEEDPAKAEAIVAAIMAPNESVEALGPLPEAAIKALGLKPGDFTHG
jgi:hypothetical protein